MHELFLTATVSNEAVNTAVKILQGLSYMTPTPILRRRLVWDAPKTRKNIEATFIQKQGTKAPLWKILNEQLMRQPYIVQIVYDLEKDQFPTPSSQDSEADSTVDCDKLEGSLQWYEVPEPGEKRCNSRQYIHMDNEPGLCTLLQSMNYRFAAELLEEGYQAVHENIIFNLTRYLTFPSQETDDSGQPKINSRLPPFEEIKPYDPENKWMLTAKVRVMSGNDTETMKEALKELLAIKEQCEGCFNFKVYDRLIFDTRVKN